MRLRRAVFLHLVELEGAIARAHAACDVHALERRACRRRRAGEAAVLREDHLAIRSNVDEERRALLLLELRREDAGRDVRTDIGRNDRRQVDVAKWRHVELRSRDRVAALDDRRVRELAERLGVRARREVDHRRVATVNRFINILALDVVALAELVDRVVEFVADGFVKELQAFLFRRHVDARDDILRVEALRIQCREAVNFLTGVHVNERRDERRRADVDGEAVKLVRRVAVFLADFLLAREDERLVFRRGVDLLDVWIDAVGERLAFAQNLQRLVLARRVRRDDRDVAIDFRMAGEHVALRRELRRHLEVRFLREEAALRPLDLHFALAARANAVARRLDDDAGVARSLEDRRAFGGLHMLVLLFEIDVWHTLIPP